MYCEFKKKISFLACQHLMLVVLSVSSISSYAEQTSTKTVTPQAAATKEAAVKATTEPVSQTVAANTDVVADSSKAPVTIQDPYEGFNRAMFVFNDKIDTYFMKPIATGYNYIMPTPINEGIHNFFNNIGELPTIANDVLQLNIYRTMNDVWRFGINSTVGILGFFDVASRIGIKYYTNDFGLTMAAWGWENSNYLVLPFFGPNTLRDGIGIPVDYFAFSVYPHIHPLLRRYAIYSLNVVDRRAQLLKFQSVLEEVSLDKYVFMRNAYLQHRAYQINAIERLGYNGSNTSGAS